MKRKGFRECPGCGIMIEKINGCNHMKHKKSEGCTNPLGKDNITHFCYTCGEILYEYLNEKSGQIHFVNGVFNPCRKASVLNNQRCIVM